MIKSENFSGTAKILLVLCILLCIGATTALIVTMGPKNAPENATVSTVATDAETLRGQEVIREYARTEQAE